MKKIVLLFLIGYTALQAQIAIKYAIPPTNGTLQKMEHSSWGQANIDKNGRLEFTTLPFNRVLITYNKGKPKLVQHFWPQLSEFIPVRQVEFMYNGNKIASVKEYTNRSFPDKKDLQLNEISIPQYEKGVMVSETIFDDDHNQVAFIKYISSNTRLIISDNYVIENGDMVKIGRSGIQFDGSIPLKRFEIEGGDTLSATARIRSTDDGYICNSMVRGMDGLPQRVTYQVVLKKDKRKNIVSEIIYYDLDRPQKSSGTVTTYRYQYKGDPEWPVVNAAPALPEEKIVEVKNDKPAEIEAMDEALVEVEAPPAPVEDPNEVHTVVENPPSFPGGESAMMQYITMNLKYPQIAKENGIEGKVIVSFIVEKEGALTDLKVVRDIGAGCGSAAMDMVRSMPKWTPGQQRGRPVRVKYTLPVKFNLSK